MKRFLLALGVLSALLGATVVNAAEAQAAGPRYCGSNCNPPAPLNYALWYNTVHHPRH